MSSDDSSSAATRLLLVDDSTHVTDLFAEVLRQRLGWVVVAAAGPAEVTPELIANGGFHIAVVDLSYGPGATPDGTRTDGLELLRALYHKGSGTRLVVSTDGDSWLDEVLLEARVTLPVAAVLDKTASIDEQVAVLQAVV